MTESIIIIDFGSQVTKLIARRIREFGVFSQIVPFNKVTRKLLSAYKNNMFEEAENIALSMTNEFPAYNLSWKILAAIYAQSGDSHNSIKFSLLVFFPSNFFKFEK